MSNPLREALVRFLDALDAIEAGHPEVTDTDVRIQMEEIIEDKLITHAHQLDVSDVFGMFSDDGNRRVQAALAGYLAEIVPLADSLGLDIEARLTAVWDLDARSHNGTPVVDYLSYGCPGWPDVANLVLSEIDFLVGRIIAEVRGGERVVFVAGLDPEPRLYADVGDAVCVDGFGEPVALSDLVGRTVRRVSTTGGVLQLEFAGSTILSCEPNPNFEAWQVVGGSPETLVVCLPGGEWLSGESDLG